MRLVVSVLVLAACGDDGGANKLPDAPIAPDAPIDSPVDAEIDAPIDANVTITMMSSFPVTNACGLAFDQTANEVLVYTCNAADITRFSTTGTNLGTITRPGEAANDVDLDVLSATVVLNGTALPPGALMFINGESGVAEVYSGAVTLATQFGASHVVGGALHPSRQTIFLLQDNVAGATDGNRVAEIDPSTGAVIQTWQTTPHYSVNYGDLDVCPSSGNLFLVSNSETTMAEFTPTGTFIGEYPLPTGASDGAGLAIVDGTTTAWIGTPSGTAYLLRGLPCK